MAALALPGNAAADHIYGDVQWGTGGEGADQFAGAAGLDTDSLDNVYVADYDHHRIQKFSPDGEHLGSFGSFGSTTGKLNHPIDVAVDSGGNVWVADQGNHRIQRFAPDGSSLPVGGPGTLDGQFDTPFAVATDSADNVYVADYGNHRVQKLDSTGGHLLTWGGLGTGDGQFGNPALPPDSRGGPSGIAVTGSTVYVTDYDNDRVQYFGTNGAYAGQFGSGTLDQPLAVDVAPTGVVAVVDSANFRVMHFGSTGGSPTQVGSAGTGPGEFESPLGLSASSLNRFFVSDTSANRVQRFDGPATGSVVRTSGTRLIFEARSGDTNTVTISQSGNTYTVQDPGNSLAGGGGCSGTGTVTCTSSITTTSVRATLLNGDDSLTVTGTTPVIADGGSGGDDLTGGSGDDTLTGGPDDDTLTGGGGTDTVSYSAVTSDGLTVDLATLTPQNTVRAGTDWIGSVENVTGSPHADALAGDGNSNTLSGGSGNDQLNGAGGNDTLAGGGDNDTASYAGASAAVTVSLAAGGPQATGGSGTDTLSGVENLTGSSHGDVLTGDSGVNLVSGAGGDDDLRVNDTTADTANCGAGTADQVTADAADTTAGCETVTIVGAPTGGGGGGGGGSSGPAPGPGGGATGPAPTAPTVSGLAAPKMRRGRAGTFSYTLSAAASVTISLDRVQAGRKVGKACKKQTRKNRKKRRCTMFVPLGKLMQSGQAGKNALRFSGRLAGRALKPGIYRATAVATNSGGKSGPTTAKFAVTR